MQKGFGCSTSYICLWIWKDLSAQISLQVDFNRKWKLIDQKWCEVKLKNSELLWQMRFSVSTGNQFTHYPSSPQPGLQQLHPTHTHTGDLCVSSHDAVCVARWGPGKQTLLFSHFPRIQEEKKMEPECSDTSMASFLQVQHVWSFSNFLLDLCILNVETETMLQVNNIS